MRPVLLTLSLLGGLLYLGTAIAEEVPYGSSSDPSMGSTLDPSRSGTFGLDIGTEAPDFTVTTYDGREINLRRDLINNKDWTVVMTYRGDWARESAAQLEYLQRTNDLIKDQDTQVIAISTDPPETIAEMRTARDLPYEVLSDPQATMMRNYNLLKPATEAEFRQYVMDNTFTPDGQSLSDAFDFRAGAPEIGNNIPQPAVMILDPKGIIRYFDEIPPEPIDEGNKVIIEELARLQAPALQSSQIEEVHD